MFNNLVEPYYTITYNNSGKMIKYEEFYEASKLFYDFTYQGNNISSATYKYNGYYSNFNLIYDYKNYDTQNNPQQIDEIDIDGIEETKPYYYNYTYDNNKNCIKLILNTIKNEISTDTIEIEREIEYY